MALTVQNIYGLMLRSRLLSANDARALYERWQKEARDNANDVERFRRWLISHQYLTDYQATLLCRGHAEGFFISEYKVLDRLGRGRMAGVYKAVHNTGQVVAVKVLPPSKARVPYLLSRFEREAKLATQLKHPNVVRTFHTGFADGVHHMVMEYLEGETLDDVLARRKKLPPGEAVRIIWLALQGLQHIHEKNMVHRDLKPSNIMLTPARGAGQPDSTMQANVKILDIGLGRMFFDESVGGSEEELKQQLTGEGVLLGTPDYLAPEQARNARGVDIRADIYSLGCVLYHILSGQVPYPDTNIINQMIRHAQETPRRLREFNPEVSEALQQIVDALMTKDYNQRISTPVQAAQALQSLLPRGTESARNADDPQMARYLNWVDNRPAAPAAAARAAVPAAAVPALKSNSSSDPKSGRIKRKKHKQDHPVGIPVAAAAGGGGIDVELVSHSSSSRSGRKRKRKRDRSTGDGRRSWLLLVLAGLAIIAAVGAGAVAAYFSHAFGTNP